MTSQLEGNELIAKYDDGTYWGINYSHHNALRAPVRAADVTNYRDMGYTIQLPYDSDWNWLIPVIKKVIKDLNAQIEKDPHAIMGYPYEMEIRKIRYKLIDMLPSLVMDKLWETCIEVIQLLNKLKDEQPK